MCFINICPKHYTFSFITVKCIYVSLPTVTCVCGVRKVVYYINLINTAITVTETANSYFLIKCLMPSRESQEKGLPYYQRLLK